MSYTNEVRSEGNTPLNMEGPSENELATMPLDQLRLLALREAKAAQANQERPASAVDGARGEAKRQSAAAKAEAAERAEGEVTESESEVFVVSRTIDIGEGAGPEVFSAEGSTREEALENLVAVIAEGKKNATRKIRSQEARLRELEAQNSAVDLDNEYVIGQKLQLNPTEGLDLMVRKASDGQVSLKDLTDAAVTHKNFLQSQQSQQEVNAFLASHENYQDEGKEGVRNGSLMRMKLAELGLPMTAEKLHRAFVELSAEGLLTLRGNNAEANTVSSETEAVSPREQQFRDEKGRFVRPAQQPAAKQPQRKTSGISSQNTTRATPRPAGVTESEAYAMDIDTLRAMANKQLAEQGGTSGVEGYVSRQSGIIADRVRK